MANYANLLATIAANIYTNGNQEVTAAMVKTAMNEVVNTLGVGYQFMGVAHPANTPSGYADLRAFWLAGEAGTYTDFGGLVLNEGEVALLKYNGSWSKEVTGAAKAAQLTELGQEVDDILDVTNGDVNFPSSFTAGGFINADNGEVSTSSVNSYSDYVDISGYEGKTIAYTQGTSTSATGTAGMAFYDSAKNYISGVLQVFGASSKWYRENTVTIPEGAAFARFTIWTDFVADFYARIVGGNVNSQRLVAIETNIGEYTESEVTDNLSPSWINGYYVYSRGEGMGGLNTSAASSASDLINISAWRGKDLTYTRVMTTTAQANVRSGLCFYDKSGVAISGVDSLGGQSSAGYYLYTTKIPTNAFFVRFTFTTDSLASFQAYIKYDAKVYSSGLGLDVQLLSEDLTDLKEDFEELTGEASSFTETECRVRFYQEMTDWCKSHGINGAIIEGPSGYGAGGEVTTETLGHGQAQVPIYGVAKIAMIASSYHLINKIQSEDYHIIRTKGTEANITVESRIHASAYEAALTDYYDVLLSKGGTKSGAAVNLVAICDSADFLGKIVVGVIRTTQTSTETESLNKYLAFKYLMDIAKAKIANSSADVSALETLLSGQLVQNAVAIILPYGNAMLYHDIDLAASHYSLYHYNVADINTMSMIKLLTAIVALDYIPSLDTYVTVTSGDIAASAGGTGQIFAAGEKVTYRDLIYALLMQSSNPAGYAIARAVGGYLLAKYRGDSFLPTE